MYAHFGSFQRGRQRRIDGSSVAWGAFHGEASANQGQPFAHARQSETPGPALSKNFGVEPLAVVFHDDPQLSGGMLRRDADPLRLRMLGDIGQRFLDHSIDRH